MLGSYLFILRRRALMVLILIAVLAPLGYGYLTTRSPVYRSEAVIEVGTGAVADQLLGQSRPFEEPTRRLATESEVVTSRPVAERAVRRLLIRGISLDVDEALSRVEAAPRRSSNYVEVTSRASTPVSARELTTAFVMSYFEHRRASERAELRRLEQELQARLTAAEQELLQLSQQAGTSATADRERAAALARVSSSTDLLESVRLRLTVEPTGVELLSEASTPARPANEVSPLVAVVAALAGAGLAAAAVAVGLDLVRDAVRTRQEAERLTAAPVLGSVTSGSSGRPTTASPNVDLQGGRALRLGLLARHAGTLPETVLLAAPDDAHDQAGLAAFSLASACAQAGQRVLVVADRSLGLTPSASFHDSGSDSAPEHSLGASPVVAVAGLHIRPLLQGVWACRATNRDGETGLLDVPRPSEALAGLRDQFELVLLASGGNAVRPADLAHLTEATVAVCALGVTRARPFVRLLDSLEHDNRLVDGVALVAAEPRRRRPRAGSDAVVRERSAATAWGRQHDASPAPRDVVLPVPDNGRTGLLGGPPAVVDEPVRPADEPPAVVERQSPGPDTAEPVGDKDHASSPQVTTGLGESRPAVPDSSPVAPVAGETPSRAAGVPWWRAADAPVEGHGGHPPAYRP